MKRKKASLDSKNIEEMDESHMRPLEKDSSRIVDGNGDDEKISNSIVFIRADDKKLTKKTVRPSDRTIPHVNIPYR